MFKDSLLNCCICKIVDSVCYLSEMLYRKQKEVEKQFQNKDIEYLKDLYVEKRAERDKD